MIQRKLLQTIQNSRKNGFITVLYGPRRVGKTVLLKEYLETQQNTKKIMFNGDTQEARDALGTTSQIKLEQLVAPYDIIAIDEVQRIPHIALALKILIDQFPHKQFFVTGSTSLDIAKGFQETLTGRTMTYQLYPLSTEEISIGKEPYQIPELLHGQLLYGGYPYVQSITTVGEKQDYLETITNDYLLKDITDLARIHESETLRKLAILLAFQIGSEVSYNEIATILGIDVKTVMRYISLLKKSFILFELGAYAKNLRNEVAHGKKYYFWDTGIRNALIRQYADISVRQDKGGLWENFLAIERIKKHSYARIHKTYYFWRTYQNAEIDWIEDIGGEISAYEFKYNASSVKTPKAFWDTYHRKVQCVSKETYLSFVLDNQ